MEGHQVSDQALKNVARGAAIVFLGTVVAMVLGFGTRIMIVRYLTQSEYGIYSLALGVVGVCSVVASLGLAQGATRYIAYFRGRGETSKIRGVVFSSLGFTLAAAICLSVIVFAASEFLSVRVFDKPELSTPLKILSASVPFIVLIAMLTSVFRGFDRVDVKVVFQDVLTGALSLVMVVFVILLSLRFLGVIYAVVASLVVTSFLLGIYTMKRRPWPAGGGGGGASPVRRELLLFSLPLLGSAMLGLVIQWTDIFMLGYLKTASDVGLYNGALPLARLIPIPLVSMNFLYVPVFSQLYSSGLMDEIRRSYQVLTKWIFVLSFPLFLLLLLFPWAILNLLFGIQYVEAEQALRILSLGFVFHTFLGANGMTLMVVGDTKPILWAGLLGAAVNVVLNAALIPPLGITGAAVASAVSYITMNIFLSAWLYHRHRTQPFTRNYLKPVVASGLIIGAIYALAINLFTVTIWMLPLFLVLFVGVYGLSLLLTKSFDSEDIMLLLAIEERLGVNLTPIKDILRRFV